MTRSITGPAGVRRVCLIACSASKLNRAAPAHEIYTGDVFRKSLVWARLQTYEDIVVLSPRHHVVDLQDSLQPYDGSMYAMSVDERRRWASIVFASIDTRWDLRAGGIELVMLAGAHYAEELALRIQVVAPRVRLVCPLAGLGVGQQKAWLRDAIAAHERACAG
ncbi:MAG: hypothetical protein JF606_27475 [Burkholderiales bacterium]|jgi:hypothetical protein|nr:hypothetical protein [Burkholderiales bacterium]